MTFIFQNPAGRQNCSSTRKGERKTSFRGEGRSGQGGHRFVPLDVEGGNVVAAVNTDGTGATPLTSLTAVGVNTARPGLP